MHLGSFLMNLFAVWRWNEALNPVRKQEEWRSDGTNILSLSRRWWKLSGLLKLHEKVTKNPSVFRRWWWMNEFHISEHNFVSNFHLCLHHTCLQMAALLLSVWGRGLKHTLVFIYFHSRVQHLMKGCVQEHNNVGKLRNMKEIAKLVKQNCRDESESQSFLHKV